MNNVRYGGGACCKYCGKYIFNAGFSMAQHLRVCTKNPENDKESIMKKSKTGSAFIILFCLILSFVVFSVRPFFAHAEYFPGNKFMNQDNNIITLVDSIPVYAPTDRCLTMQRQGYDIYCQPVAIDYKWKVEIDIYGVIVDGVVTDEVLKNMEPLEEQDE